MHYVFDVVMFLDLSFLSSYSAAYVHDNHLLGITRAAKKLEF